MIVTEQETALIRRLAVLEEENAHLRAEVTVLREQQTAASMGRKGGMTTLNRLGVEHLQEIGRRGGQANKDAHDQDHFAKLGHKGGSTLLRERGREFFAEIGRRGAAARRAKANGG